MKIIYCRIGWMNSYTGLVGDSIKFGGSYNENNIGHEIYNFAVHEGQYYGYVQPPADTINIDRIDEGNNNEDFIDDVLVVWVARSERDGQVIVGWYDKARVYRKFQRLPEEIFKIRNKEGVDDYIMTTREAFLILPTEDRRFKIREMGRANVWYGDPETDERVVEYIRKCEAKRDEVIRKIDSGTEELVGEEKEALIKVRVNQSGFRNALLWRYRHCCLCGVDAKELLVASHIKPWRASEPNEKVSEYNGLLLCPNHDKLFDKGYISFDNEGRILISPELSEENRTMMNVREDMRITVAEYSLAFLEYHRENVFRGAN